jgi:hypothetical protein
MHVSQNYMRLVFAKLNINSHRAFVNVMASTSLSKGSFTSDDNCYKGRSKDKGKVCQYVKRLQCGGERNNDGSATGIDSVLSSNKNSPYIHYHHRKSQSIEDLVKRDTHERIKYKYKT